VKNWFGSGLALVLLLGCAASNIRYDVTPPAGASAAAPEEFAGVYRGQLPFRTLAMSVADGQRVVVLSDLGMKLIDMKIMEKTTDVYWRASFVPYHAVADFADFFRDYFAARCVPMGAVGVNSHKPERRGDGNLWIKPL
jgi:hypothetical protein